MAESEDRKYSPSKTTVNVIGPNCHSTKSTFIQETTLQINKEVFNDWKTLKEGDDWDTDSEFASHLLRLYSVWRTSGYRSPRDRHKVKDEKLSMELEADSNANNNINISSERKERKVIEKATYSQENNVSNCSASEKTTCTQENDSPDSIAFDVSDQPDCVIIDKPTGGRITEQKTSFQRSVSPDSSVGKKAICFQRNTSSDECISEKTTCFQRNNSSDGCISEETTCFQRNNSRGCSDIEKSMLPQRNISSQRNISPNSSTSEKAACSRRIASPDCLVTCVVENKRRYDASKIETDVPSKYGRLQNDIIEERNARKQRIPRKRNHNMSNWFASSIDVPKTVSAKELFLSQHILKRTIEVPYGNEPHSSRENNSMQTSTKDNHFPCPLCGTKFTIEQNLEHHMTIHGLSSAEFEEMKTVNTQKTQKIIPVYVCKSCGRQFGKRNHLVTHLKHGRPVVCKKCNKIFACKASLSIHSKMHSSLKQFKCDVCRKCYSSNISLHAHAWTHLVDSHRKQNMESNNIALGNNSKNVEKQKCEMCGIKFSKIENLKLHMEVHRKGTEFSCDMCGIRFSKSENLKLHMKVHREGS